MTSENSARAQEPLVGITMGDPAGVGPEVIVKAVASSEAAAWARYVVIGSPAALERAVKACDLTLRVLPIGDVSDVPNDPATLAVLSNGEDLPEDLRPGRLDARAGALAVHYIRTAVQLALDEKIGAMATAPVNKEAVELSGLPFTGHTELLQELTGAASVSMMLVAKTLRVAHVSTHVSLRRAVELVQPARIVDVVELVVPALRMLGFAQPRIAIAGLNPHAGEHGLFGQEDAQLIAPAVETCRKRGWRVSGPHAADSIFHRAVDGEFDAVIAMYHDQGHVAVKQTDFYGAVNVTLGLPIARTSVDHGTGFDIVGRGIARPDSMIAALELAAVMARHRAGTSAA